MHVRYFLGLGVVRYNLRGRLLWAGSGNDKNCFNECAEVPSNYVHKYVLTDLLKFLSLLLYLIDTIEGYVSTSNDLPTLSVSPVRFRVPIKIGVSPIFIDLRGSTRIW